MKSRKIREVDFAKSGLSAGWCPISLSLVFNSCGWAWEDYWGLSLSLMGILGILSCLFIFCEDLVTISGGCFLTVSAISESSSNTVSSFLTLEEDEDALGKGDLVVKRLHGDGGREVVEEGVVRKTTVGFSYSYP